MLSSAEHGPRYRVAVIGATGVVGREIVELLEELGFPVSELRLYASERSVGETLRFGDEDIAIERLPEEAPAVDVAFVCVPGEAGEMAAEELASQGAVVIDADPGGRADAPATLADWNADSVAGEMTGGGIVRVPSPLTVLIGRVLRALDGVVRPVQVLATAFLPAAAFGKDRLDRLFGDTMELLGGREAEPREGASTAFTCEPEERGPGGGALEAVGKELATLVGLASPFRLGAVRGPVFHGLGVSLWIEAETIPDVERIRAALREAPSILLGDSTGTLDAVGADAILVAAPVVDDHWIRLWAVADGVRLLVALSAVTLASRILAARSLH